MTAVQINNYCNEKYKPTAPIYVSHTANYTIKIYTPSPYTVTYCIYAGRIDFYMLSLLGT